MCKDSHPTTLSWGKTKKPEKKKFQHQNFFLVQSIFGYLYVFLSRPEYYDFSHNVVQIWEFARVPVPQVSTPLEHWHFIVDLNLVAFLP